MKTIERLGFLVAGAALTIALTPLFERVRANAVRSSCQSNLKQIGLSFLQYARDYDESFPLTGNWQSALQPYGRYAPQIWRCPGQTFTYVYNSHLGGINDGQVDKNQQITLVYEGATTRRADNGQSWFAKAHDDGSNVLYMDAHVKWEPQKPLFFSPEMANSREWQRKHNIKVRTQLKEYFRKYPRSQRPLEYR